MIAGILSITSVLVSNLFNTNKVLMGFVAYFAIQAILFFIGFFFGLSAALTGDITAINNSSYIFSHIQSLIIPEQVLWYLLHHDQTLKFKLKKNRVPFWNTILCIEKTYCFVLYDKVSISVCYPKRVSLGDNFNHFWFIDKNSRVGFGSSPSRLSYVPRLGLE